MIFERIYKLNKTKNIQKHGKEEKYREWLFVWNIQENYLDSGLAAGTSKSQKRGNLNSVPNMSTGAIVDLWGSYRTNIVTYLIKHTPSIFKIYDVYDKLISFLF